MRLRFLVLVFVGFEIGVWAQPNALGFSKNDTSRHIIQFTTLFEENTSTLPNKIVSYLVWGGHLNKAFLTEVRDKLKDEDNRLGFELKSTLSYRCQYKKHYRHVAIKYRELFGLNYTADLFGLTFLGNGPYEGQVANLSSTQFAHWGYTGLSYGVTKPINNGNWGQLYVGVSFLYGLNYQSLTTNSASLYTAPDAEYLRLNADFDLQYKGQKKGLGGGLDMGYQLEWGKNKLSFQLEDLGFMNWQEVTRYAGDSSYEFRGEYIDLTKSFSGDSLFTDISTTGFANRFGIKRQSSSKMVMLPFSVNLLYRREFGEKWAGSLQLYYTRMPAYVPRATARVERSFSNNWKTCVGLAYGGFGKDNLLLGVQKAFANNWSVNLETYFLGMIFLPNRSHGLGLNLGIKKGF